MVYESARAARSASRVIVATDDERIVEAVRAFGGEARMTHADHACGTDRIAEVVRNDLPDVDAVVNVQGDEPDIRPEHIDKVASLLAEDPDAVMATLACRMSSPEAHRDPNQVKVVTDAEGRALYFSRAPVPYARDVKSGAGEFLGHVGIYAYRRDFLLAFTELESTPLEVTERLEQLRALEHGYVIRVGIIDDEVFGIDTPDDLERFREKWEQPNS
jgi:3-deoxy-manno-octulosonate cytidylyltransferase (CMP-KDO synthetase)